MNKLQLLEALDIQKHSLTAKLLDKGMTVLKQEQIRDSIKATINSFNEECSVHYVNFRKFCQKNKNLYKQFSVMQRDTDRVLKFKLHHSKDSILVLLENTFDNCCDRNVVLIPFEFIKSPESFLETRKAYLTEYYENMLLAKIQFATDEISYLEKERQRLIDIDPAEFVKENLQ